MIAFPVLAPWSLAGDLAGDLAVAVALARGGEEGAVFPPPGAAEVADALVTFSLSDDSDDDGDLVGWTPPLSFFTLLFPPEAADGGTRRDAIVDDIPYQRNNFRVTSLVSLRRKSVPESKPESKPTNQQVSQRVTRYPLLQVDTSLEMKFGKFVKFRNETFKNENGRP